MINYFEWCFPMLTKFVPKAFLRLFSLPIFMFNTSKANVKSGYIDLGNTEEQAEAKATIFEDEWTRQIEDGTPAASRDPKALYDNIAGGWTPGSADSGSSSGAPSSSDSITSIIQQYLQSAPQLAEQGLSIAQQYQPQYADLYRTLVSGDREAGLADVLNLAPQLADIRSASEDPRISGLRDTLINQISEELGLGSRLTPEQDLNLSDVTRSAQVARGLESGPGAASRESVLKAIEGIGLLEKRQAKAASLIGSEGTAKADPFATILNLPTGGAQSAPLQSNAALNPQTLSFLGNNFWNAESLGFEREKYAATLDLAKQNPDLIGTLSL